MISSLSFHLLLSPNHVRIFAENTYHFSFAVRLLGSTSVIRYFGGIKLGAGGLTRAYGNAAKHVIEASQLHRYVERQKISLSIDYKRLRSLEYELNKLDGIILQQDFSDQINLVVSAPAKHAETLLSKFSQVNP